MSNSIYCFNKNGDDLGSIGQGLSCFAYAQDRCGKNGAKIELTTPPELLNVALEQFYRGTAPLSDKLPVLLFLNDRNKLVESDIPALQEAISHYPDTFNQNPKQALEAYLKVLEAEKEVYTLVNEEEFDPNLENYAATADLK